MLPLILDIVIPITMMRVSSSMVVLLHGRIIAIVLLSEGYIAWENTLISQENIRIQRTSPIYRLKNTREIDIRFILLISGNSGADAS